MNKLEFRMDSPHAAGGLIVASSLPLPIQARPRIDSIDLLRGIAMVLMALDHTRDFFAGSAFNPRDVTEPALFLTRWITTSARRCSFFSPAPQRISTARGKSQGEVSRFLFTRGLWLVFLEFTVVSLAWTFSVFPDMLLMQLVWAIGVSMIVLAGLVYFPNWAIGAFAIIMLAGHNLLDQIKAEQFGPAAWVWNVLHEPALLQLTPEVTVFALYPLIPWIGVMATGYVFGPSCNLNQRAGDGGLSRLAQWRYWDSLCCEQPMSMAIPHLGRLKTLSLRPYFRSSTTKNIRLRRFILR